MSALGQKRTSRALFNHLIGSPKKRQRDREPERTCEIAARPIKACGESCRDGSEAVRKTIGIVAVAAFAATTEGVLPPIMTFT
jgi:hypothetical protein